MLIRSRDVPLDVREDLTELKRKTAGIDAQGSATTGEFLDTGGAVFNVRAFGAVGDGNANDTLALQAAITAAGAVEGTVFLPSGIYMTDRQFIPSGVTIQGAGRGTLIKLRPQVMTDFKYGGVLNATGTDDDLVHGIVFRSFRISSNRGAHTYESGASATNTEGLELEYATNCLIEDVHAEDCESEGFDLDYSHGNVVRNCSARRCGGWGFHLSIECGPNLIDGCIAIDCGYGTSGVLAPGRGGFDQHFSATGNTYINLRAIDCYKPYQIHGTNAIVIACDESGTPEESSTYNGTRLYIARDQLIAGSDIAVQNITAAITAVIASRTSTISAERAAIIASSTAEISAVTAALLATTGCTVSGQRGAAVAADNVTVAGQYSLISASTASTTSADRTTVLSSGGSTAGAHRSAIIATNNSQTMTGAARSAVIASDDGRTQAEGSAVIAADRVRATAQRAMVVASAGVINDVPNSIAGGFSGSAPSTDAISWRIFSTPGTIWLRSYTRDALPSAAASDGQLARISDPEAGKSAFVYSDGEAWLYVGDNSSVTSAPA